MPPLFMSKSELEAVGPFQLPEISPKNGIEIPKLRGDD